MAFYNHSEVLNENVLNYCVLKTIKTRITYIYLRQLVEALSRGIAHKYGRFCFLTFLQTGNLIRW